MQTVITIPAHQLLPRDVINFGDDLCFVIATEPPAADDYMTLITEGFNGSQYVDYINPARPFTVVRTN